MGRHIAATAYSERCTIHDAELNGRSLLLHRVQLVC